MVTSGVPSVVSIRRGNLKSIVNYLRDGKLATKKEIAHGLSLSFATVSNLCNWLEEAGLIESQPDYVQDKVGRTPKKVWLNTENRLIATADIHKSNRMALRLYNLLGQPKADAEFNYSPGDIHAFVEQFVSGYRQAFCAQTRSKVDMTGVAVSGIYDTKTDNIVASELGLFDGQPLKQMLSAALEMPVYVENDANLSAFGIARQVDSQNLVYIYIGEGLGIGVVTGGKSVKGVRGHAPEICHAPLGILDSPCRLCGSKRCMQTDLSIYGFAEKFTGRPQTPGDQTGWEDFVKAYEKGQRDALAVARENAGILADALSIVVNLFDPEVVVIGGVPAKLFDELSHTAGRAVASRRVVYTAPALRFFHDKNFDETLLSGTGEMAYARWFPDNGWK